MHEIFETIARNYQGFKTFHNTYTNLLSIRDQRRFKVIKEIQLPEVVKITILKFLYIAPSTIFWAPNSSEAYIVQKATQYFIWAHKIGLWNFTHEFDNQVFKAALGKMIIVEIGTIRCKAERKRIQYKKENTRNLYDESFIKIYVENDVNEITHKTLQIINTLPKSYTQKVHRSTKFSSTSHTYGPRYTLAEIEKAVACITGLGML